MNLTKPFGPTIGSTKLSDELTEQLLDICLNAQDDADRRVNGQLVGLIEKEFSIIDRLKNTVLPTIQQQVLEYLTAGNNLFSQFAPFSKFDLTCTSSWCNIQLAGEHNPIHNHPLDDIVCVVFPKVDIDFSYKKYNTSVDMLPGSLGFHLPGDSRFSTDGFVVTPKTSDVYIFPASLHHYTTPFFKEGDSRISVSCNFAFTEHFYSLHKLRGYR